MKGLQFINDNDIEYKNATTTELVVRICPWCGDDKYKLYVNKETGLYDCKICGQQGNIYMLKAKYGSLDEIQGTLDVLRKKYKPMDWKEIIIAEEEFSKNKNAQKYMKERGFTLETLKHFRIGVQEEWIYLPHIFENELWNIKKRRWIGDKAFQRITGQPTVLFNVDNLNYTKKAVVIVESETDCMAAYQMGLHNVIAITGGAQSFKPEWLLTFNKFKEVYIVLNSDNAGQEGARKIAEKIGFPKCYNVKLSVKDVNNYLVSENPELFKKFIKENAYKFSIKNISVIADYVQSIDKEFDGEGSLEGLRFEEFPKLDKILNGFKSEDLIIVIGDSGVGKTTWVLNIALQLIRKDHKVLLFCLEGKINYYILRLMCMQSGKKIDELRSDETEWEVLKDTFSEFPLYFYSGAEAEMDPKKLGEMLPAAVKLYDFEFVGIDNLQKLVKGYSDVFQRTGDAISILKDNAVDLKIPILIISHVKKLDSNNRHNISMHDAKHSSTIYQDADIFLIINVKKNGDYEIVVEKNRMGEGGIRFPISLNKSIGKFYETDIVPADQTKKLQESSADEDFIEEENAPL